MKMPLDTPRLKRIRYPSGIISYAAWVYYRFALSTVDPQREKIFG